VGDAGLAHLRGLAQLRTLDLKSTNATSAGVAELRRALPLCQVESDFPAPSDPKAERAAAMYLLALGGTGSVAVKDRVVAIAGGAALPPEAFRLVNLSLRDNPLAGDAVLAHFRDCLSLTDLDLRGTPVGDAGLTHFKDCRGLTHLDLRGTKVTDAGLAHLRGLANLRALDLKGTQATPAAVAALRAVLPKCQVETDFPEQK
jgi:hypothetical protein